MSPHEGHHAQDRLGLRDPVQRVPVGSSASPIDPALFAALEDMGFTDTLAAKLQALAQQREDAERAADEQYLRTCFTEKNCLEGRKHGVPNWLFNSR